MYDHLGGGDSTAVYDDAAAGSFAEKAARSRADGFSAVKILAVGKTAPLDGLAALKDAERLMAAAREGAGDDMDIMVDLHGRTSAAMAIQYAKVLEPYRPFFLEEPCQPEDPEGIARVARSTPIPIAAGERLTHRHEFLPLLQSQAIAVAQPDVCHAGGLTEIRRIAALCDTFGVSMAPHNPLGPIATMVNIHLGFATPELPHPGGDACRRALARRDRHRRDADRRRLRRAEPGAGHRRRDRFQGGRAASVSGGAADPVAPSRRRVADW